MLPNLIVSLEHLRVLLELVPHALNELLEEDSLDLSKEVSMARIDLVVCLAVLLKDTLHAQEIYLVDVVDEEVVLGVISHSRELEQV